MRSCISLWRWREREQASSHCLLSSLSESRLSSALVVPLLPSVSSSLSSMTIISSSLVERGEEGEEGGEGEGLLDCCE